MSSLPSPNLSAADEERLLRLINSEQAITAVKEFRAITGWGLADSKKWLDEVGLPLALQRPDLTPPKEETPCPYCGLPLRTPRAKQCRHCKRDWHSENF